MTVLPDRVYVPTLDAVAATGEIAVFFKRCRFDRLTIDAAMTPNPVERWCAWVVRCRILYMQNPKDFLSCEPCFQS